jgi:hypothetical protein
MNKLKIFQKKNKKIVIGFVLNYDLQKWLGGVYVIKNLIQVINFYYKNIYLFKIIVNSKNKNIAKSIFNESDVIVSDLFDKKKLSFYYNIIKIIFFGKSNTYDYFFIKNKINLVSHSIYLGRKSLIPSFYWIPDFQHIEMKAMFSFIGRLLTHLNILCGIKNCTKIILSSHHNKKLFKRYFNVDNKTILISRFRFFLNYQKLKSNLKKKYNLPKKYFIITNQFWKHKNHNVLINAINHLNEHKFSNNKIHLVMTGKNFDHRNKNYFRDIMNKIEKLKLKGNIRYLGVIKSDDLFFLIKNSIALINPSLYEGWNSGVEQAMALNKKTILSFIATHKEQADENTYFFSTNDYKKLSEHLVNLLRSSNIKPKKRLYINDIKKYAINLNSLFQNKKI